MSKFPSKPTRGQPAIKQLYNSIIQIIDYLPTLSVVGDQRSTYVTKSSAGTVIHAAQPNSTHAKAKEYVAGSGITITSGNIINAKLSAGPNINIDYNSGWLVISGTPEGGGGGGTTIIDNSLVPNLSALNYNNEPLTYDGYGITWLIPVSAGQRITFATGASGNVNASYAPAKGKSGSAFAIERDVLSTIPQDGFVRITAFDDGSQRNQCLRVLEGTTDWDKGLPLYRFKAPPSTVVPSGGRYIDVQQTSTRINPETEQEEIYTLSRPIINNTLSGDHEVYNTGLITIVPQYDSGYNITGGVISSILHAGSGLSIDYGTGEIKLTSSISPGPTPVGTFYAPDYAKLSTSQDVGDLIGLGTTFTLPVSKGSTLRFDSAVASATVGVWAPVEGSDKSAFNVTDTNQTTQDDGYVRISVIDEGLISAGCLRLYVNDHDIPLHKFAKFNQGKVYDAGRYMQIQTTSTRINQQDQEQTYDLQNPLIHNMLTGGRFITIQQTEMINGTETQLKYPRINCDLTEGSNISISSAGIISVTGITNNIPTPVANTVLSATAGGQMTWQPNTGGGGGPVTYVSGFYPNWGHGNHDSVVIPSNDSYSAPLFTMAQNGWIYAWASFNPSYDGFRYSSYRAHVIVGGAWFKVCELLLPFQKAELTLSSSSNIASQVPNGNYTRYPEGDVTNKFYLSGTYYDQQKEENVDFMVQCTRSEGNDQYETLYDGNDDQSGRNYTKFAWGVSNRPTENLPNVLYTNDQFITSNSYYDIYYKDQNDDFQPLYYLDGISNTMGKKSEDYTYFAWKSNNDIIFSRRYGGMHQNIGAPTEYSISTLIYNYQSYIEDHVTPLTSNRINFQNYSADGNTYWVKATASNVSDIAIGVGAAITIPARKGKNVQFKVETDNNGTYSVPISYGQQYGGGPYPVACVVYYDDPPEE